MSDDDNEHGEPTAPPTTFPRVKVGRLDTLSRVRREAARLYRDLRNRRIGAKNTQAGCRALDVITKVLEVESLERRLGELEERAGLVEAGRQSRSVTRSKLLS